MIKPVKIANPNIVDNSQRLSNAVQNKTLPETGSGNTILQKPLNQDFLFNNDFAGNLKRFKLEKMISSTRDVISETRSLTRSLNYAQSSYREAYPPGGDGLLQFSETKSACDIAYKGQEGDVYQYPDGSYWRVDEVRTGDSGFRGVVLRRVVPDGEGGFADDPADNRVVLAFAGTNSGDDINDDIMQGVGLTPSQYDEAVNMTNEVNAEAQQNGETLVLTGHSLGGGMAVYASIETGVPATAINSAPLSNNKVPDDASYDDQITQYYVEGEALTVLDETNPTDSRPGEMIEIEGGYESPSLDDLEMLPDWMKRIWFMDDIYDVNANTTEAIENHKLKNSGDGVPAPEKIYPPSDDDNGGGGGGKRGFN